LLVEQFASESLNVAGESNLRAHLFERKYIYVLVLICLC